MGLLKTLSLLVVFSILFTSCVKNKRLEKKSFTINLPREIHSVDPLLLRGTATRYILFNVHRGLFYYNQKNELTSYGAKSCSWTSNKTYDCLLADKKWSDGSPIKAKNYVYSYQQIKSLGDESMSALEDVLDVQAVETDLLRFVLSEKNQDFAHRLTSVILSPRNENRLFKTSKGQAFSGPYKVKDLNKKNIRLEANEHFNGQSRPEILGVFVDDPSAALNMFESGKLDFLRYLESSNIGAYKNTLFAPFAKLDGLFLNRDKLSLEARKALIYSLNFKSLQKVYKSPSVPGCLALPASFFKKEINCFELDIIKAKKFLDQSELKTKKLKIHIPNADADEHKKLALWAREQWLKNLGINVEIQLVEAKTFYADVKKSDYTIYRKAHPLDNLSCLDALKSLKREVEFKGLALKNDCREFFEAALDLYSWIPLGLPYYAHLPPKNFSGYYINLLGQFGLEDLKRTNEN